MALIENPAAEKPPAKSGFPLVSSAMQTRRRTARTPARVAGGARSAPAADDWSEF